MNQEDRELLELAAKAAGYVIDEYTDDGAWVYENTAEPNEDGEYPVFLWRPRHDDGDALRLAVKTGVMDGRGFKNAWAAMHAVGQLPKDRYVAYRGAIVCAAAEIGRTMP